MSIRHALVLAFSLVAVSASSASANPREACHPDVERFCKGIQPGGGRIMKCLKQHEPELSPECKQAGAQVKERMKEVHAACESDINAFCKDIDPGGGRIGTCLKANADRLSEQCKAAAAKFGHRR